MTFRYIGSKARLVQQIADHIGIWKEGVFVDAFCGTGSIAEVAAGMGWPVRVNDHLVSATIMSAARLVSTSGGQFRQFGGYENAIAELQRAKPVRGFIWREYSPASSRRISVERRYFTEANAAKIDGVRSKIAEWSNQRCINRKEEMVLIADLLSATNRVANTAGTYGCFLSQWTSQASQPLALRPRMLKQHPIKVQMSNVNAVDVECRPEDVVYLDPPYTKRQYASYYHILETIAHADEPVVEGVAGLRPWRSLASDFCYKIKALNALTKLIASLPSRRILLSYSSEGHVDLDALDAGLKTIGAVKTHELATVSRYRPNVAASAGKALVSEFLIIIEKRKALLKPRRELALA
jgi:adenine-specific DNA-methyltransferase